MGFFGRGKNRAKNPYTFKDMYKEYIKDKEEGSPYRVDYNTFVELCSEFYKGISEHILNGGIYFMPYRMGNISCLLYTSPSPRDRTRSRMPSSA